MIKTQCHPRKKYLSRRTYLFPSRLIVSICDLQKLPFEPVTANGAWVSQAISCPAFQRARCALEGATSSDARHGQAGLQKCNGGTETEGRKISRVERAHPRPGFNPGLFAIPLSNPRRRQSLVSLRVGLSALEGADARGKRSPRTQLLRKRVDF